MLLVVDAGNTNVAIGVYREEELRLARVVYRMNQIENK